MKYAVRVLMNARVAITIWNGRVSPVMDTACRLLVLDIVDGRQVSRDIINIPQGDMSYRASFISELGIDTLICGAVSQQFNQVITALGTKTYPWCCGDVNEIVVAYSSGTFRIGNFPSPGCRQRQRRRGRGQPGEGCRKSGRIRHHKEEV